MVDELLRVGVQPPSKKVFFLQGCFSLRLPPGGGARGAHSAQSAAHENGAFGVERKRDGGPASAPYRKEQSFLTEEFPRDTMLARTLSFSPRRVYAPRPVEVDAEVEAARQQAEARKFRGGPKFYRG